MQLPVEITFRGLPPSPGLELMVRDWTRTLVQVLPIQRCAVVIETSDDLPFHVHLAISIPGHRVSVTRGADNRYRDPYLAIADVFRAARRELLDRVEQQQLRSAS